MSHASDSEEIDVFERVVPTGLITELTRERDQARKEVVELKKKCKRQTEKLEHMSRLAGLNSRRRDELELQLRAQPRATNIEEQLALLTARVEKLEGPQRSPEAEELFVVSEFELDNACCSSQVDNEVTRVMTGVFSKTQLQVFIEKKIVEYVAFYKKKPLIPTASHLRNLARAVIAQGSLGCGARSCKCGKFLFIETARPHGLDPKAKPQGLNQSLSLQEYEVADLNDLMESDDGDESE